MSTRSITSLFSIYVVEIGSSSRDADSEMRWIQDGDDGGSHECQKHSLEDKHREDQLVEDTSREANVENDQLHQPVNNVSMNLRKDGNEGMVLPFTTHQGSDSCRFAPVEPSNTRRRGASTEFSKVSRGADRNRVPPNDASVE